MREEEDRRRSAAEGIIGIAESGDRPPSAPRTEYRSILSSPMLPFSILFGEATYADPNEDDYDQFQEIGSEDDEGDDAAPPMCGWQACGFYCGIAMRQRSRGSGTLD